LLCQAPFDDASTFSNPSVGVLQSNLLVQGHARSAAIQLWKPEAVQLWLHACSVRAVQLLSVEASNLVPLRIKIRDGFNLPDRLVRRYGAVTVAEFNPGPAPAPLPREITDSDNTLLALLSARVKNNERVAEGGRSVSSGQLPAGPNVSLESNPLVVFLQSMLPWSELDLTGTSTEGISLGGRARELLNRLTSTLGLGARAGEGKLFFPYS
jgi:hypothetical protein